MYKRIIVVLCALLCAAAYAQPRFYEQEHPGAPVVVASGFFLFGHCNTKCKELRCPDLDACGKACNDNKGTISMCPKVEGAGKK